MSFANSRSLIRPSYGTFDHISALLSLVTAGTNEMKDITVYWTSHCYYQSYESAGPLVLALGVGETNVTVINSDGQEDAMVSF